MDSHQPVAHLIPPPPLSRLDALPLRSTSFYADFPDERVGDTALKVSMKRETTGPSYSTDLAPSRQGGEEDHDPNLVGELRVSLEELEVESFKAVSGANYEMEVYKGKIKDVEDVIKLCSQDGLYKQINDLENELELYRERIQEFEAEREYKIIFLEQMSSSIETVKQCLSRMFQALNDDKEGYSAWAEEDTDHVTKRMASTFFLTQQVIGLVQLANSVERKVGKYQEMRKKERRQLESSVVSLTVENRDINTLLRVALVEKETVEKSLNRLKGNSEQKRVPLLQFAERGLHKVGFSFMMASLQTEQLTDTSTISNASSKSDDSELEDEVDSLVYF